VDKELEQYLGRAWYERRSEGKREDYRNGFVSACADGDRDLVVRMPRTEEICFEGIGLMRRMQRWIN
jgi:hypothetical protein